MLKLVDTNVWLALTLSKHRFHRVARTWLALQRSPESVLFCRATKQSYLRLLTTQSVLAPYGTEPVTNAEAWEAYRGRLANKRIMFAEEPADLELRWESLSARETASPKLWMDAYLAAFALQGDYQLVSTDKGFKQFDGLNLCLLDEDFKVSPDR